MYYEVWHIPGGIETMRRVMVYRADTNGERSLRSVLSEWRNQEGDAVLDRIEITMVASPPDEPFHDAWTISGRSHLIAFLEGRAFPD